MSNGILDTSQLSRYRQGVLGGRSRLQGALGLGPQPKSSIRSLASRMANMADRSPSASRRSASPRTTDRRGSSSRREATAATTAMASTTAAQSSPATSRQLQVASGVAPPACDACRSRKVRLSQSAGGCGRQLELMSQVKCTPLDDAEHEAQAALGSGIKCKLCVKRSEACTYDYVYKKPGRPVGYVQSPPCWV